MRDINAIVRSNDCERFLERPIDWDELVLEHPGLADEMLQRMANERPNVIPACHERRRWVENMIDVTQWVVRYRSIVSIENRTAMVHTFIHTAVSNYCQTIFITSTKKLNLNAWNYA